MKNFNDIVFQKFDDEWGVISQTFFENGYWISVVRHKFSYWWPEWLYEIAVIKETDSGIDICYETSITEDVIWHLTEQEVSEYMAKVQEL